ncbi:TetR/AcrR family transcriptional regulator [Nocardia alni]|uniref:TetR/AcrR family transcriptional regulator n=1 Tax=Nocardia alni TaxID=2815723 RepID=UPI001C24E671|nr:TetR/AcrR family transcriptional regulator [Nocardia alni]
MDTRDRLIEATRELLWDRGYVGTSPKAIQQSSGAGQGSMYHHFAGKSDLAYAAIDRTVGDRLATTASALDGPGTAVERIAAYLRAEREATRGCPVGRLIYDPDIMADEHLRGPAVEMFAQVRARLADLIAEAQASGELRAGLDPRATAASLLAIVQGGYVLARAAGSPEPFTSAVEGALALLHS